MDTVIYHFEKITFNTFEETQGKPSLLALSSTYLDIGTADHRNKTLHKGVNPPPATHLHFRIRQLLKIFRGGPILDHFNSIFQGVISRSPAPQQLRGKTVELETNHREVLHCPSRIV